MSKPVMREPEDRRHLQSIIAGLAEGILIIERDGQIAWANQAALVMHGISTFDRFPSDLAGYYQTFALTYRNNHDLAEDDYPGAKALRGEVIKDVMVNVAVRGQAASWTQRVRTVILPDDGIRPGFCAIIIDNATDEANAEARFERAFNANPAPAVICRLDDLRFIKVNRGFLEMTGHHREAIVGHSVYEVDVLENADHRELAIRKLNAGEPIPQMESQLALPDGGWRTVIVAGQPIEMGEQACMLFTFIDLDHRKKAEVALRQSEERFAKAFQLAPVPMLVSSLSEYRILDANDAFVAEFGHARTNAIGRSKQELCLWADEESRLRVEKLVRETGRASSVPIMMRTNEGRAIQCLLSAETVFILEQDCILTVMQNVDEKRRSESHILAAVEAALQDSSWLGEKIVEKLHVLADGTGDEAQGQSADLSARQREVLCLISQGLADQDIAKHLKLSPNTIRNHVRSIYATIGVHRRSEAIVWARRRGLQEKRHKNFAGLV